LDDVRDEMPLDTTHHKAQLTFGWSSRPNVGKRIMPTTTHSNRDEIGVVACPDCSQPMKLTCTSPGLEGYDLVTFDCDKCERSKTFVVHQLTPAGS
jgi:hypothetical protein